MAYCKGMHYWKGQKFAPQFPLWSGSSPWILFTPFPYSLPTGYLWFFWNLYIPYLPLFIDIILLVAAEVILQVLWILSTRTLILFGGIAWWDIVVMLVLSYCLQSYSIIMKQHQMQCSLLFGWLFIFPELSQYFFILLNSVFHKRSVLIVQYIYLMVNNLHKYLDLFNEYDEHR